VAFSTARYVIVVVVFMKSKKHFIDLVKEERDVGDKPFLYNSKRVGSDILSKYGNSEER